MVSGQNTATDTGGMVPLSAAGKPHGLSAYQVRAHLVERGLLKVYRIGERSYVRPDDVTAAIEACREEGPTEAERVAKGVARASR